MTERDYCGSDLDAEPSEETECSNCGAEFTSYDDAEKCDPCLGQADCQSTSCPSHEAFTRFSDERDGDKDFVGIYCQPCWNDMKND